MGNMRRLFKINVELKKNTTKKTTNLKSQDALHNICRIRDSEHNKKRNIVLALKL